MRPSRGDEALVAEAETLTAFALARGERPVVAHDWKTIAMADEPSALRRSPTTPWWPRT